MYRNFSQASSHEEICGCLVPEFGAMVLNFMFVKVLLFLPFSKITAETRFGMVRSYQMLPLISILLHSHQWPLIKDDASNSYAESRPNGNSLVERKHTCFHTSFSNLPIFQCWIFPGCNPTAFFSRGFPHLPFHLRCFFLFPEYVVVQQTQAHKNRRV